jgi:hypothetical protein
VNKRLDHGRDAGPNWPLRHWQNLVDALLGTTTETILDLRAHALHSQKLPKQERDSLKWLQMLNGFHWLMNRTLIQQTKLAETDGNLGSQYDGRIQEF